jgi:hypothetical protein
MYNFHYGVRSYAAIGSVIIYAFIPVIFHFRAKAGSNGNSKDAERQVLCVDTHTHVISQMAILKRMTITLGISACCTFILYILPTFLKSWKILTWSTTTVGQLNSFTHIIIYTIRQAEFRAALFHLFGIKIKVNGTGATSVKPKTEIARMKPDVVENNNRRGTVP